jgi:SAM-dependent methyltransferase
LKASLKKILPRPVKTLLRRLYNSVAGNGRGTNNAPTVQEEEENGAPGGLLPPKRLQDYVGGGFVGVGPEFLRHFVELCDLKPHESVLDVGCGSGRMTLPLMNYLNSEGRYDGFDISVDAVKWCRENITAKLPNFNFQVADIYNAVYRTDTKGRASQFRFPYDDDTFDLVFLASVFTHMLPPDMENYFREIVRVMKPGGRCLITFFLLNDESTALIDDLKGEYNFEHRREGYRTVNRDSPEAAIAYPEEFVRSLYEKYGLKVREPIHYGIWCGRKNYLSFQDIVVAEKACANDV